mgnify:CR=1 FL=1
MQKGLYLLLYFPFTLRGVNAESIYLLLYFPFTLKKGECGKGCICCFTSRLHLRRVNAERVVSAALLPVYT